jgi:hypothetical protein
VGKGSTYETSELTMFLVVVGMLALQQHEVLTIQNNRVAHLLLNIVWTILVFFLNLNVTLSQIITLWFPIVKLIISCANENNLFSRTMAWFSFVAVFCWSNLTWWCGWARKRATRCKMTEEMEVHGCWMHAQIKMYTHAQKCKIWDA